MRLKIIIVFLLCLLVLVTGFYIFPYRDVNAAARVIPITKPLVGWAWAGTKDPGDIEFGGIGWISFSSQNELGPTAPYEVVYNTSSFATELGTFTGYAWANPQDATAVPAQNNIGAIKFGGLSGFPPATPDNGTNAENARLLVSIVRGWARACSVFVNGCSGPLKLDSERGGWDGWISLRGIASDALNTPYGVTYDSVTGQFGGYAWGGDVIGWINFNPCETVPSCLGQGVRIQMLKYSVVPPANVSIRPGDPDQTINITFSYISGAPSLVVPIISPTNPAAGVSLTVNNPLPCVLGPANLSCTIPVTVHVTTAAPPSQNYSININGSPPPQAVQSFNLDVGTVFVGPTVDLRVNGQDGPITVIKGQSVALTWNTTWNDLLPVAGTTVKCGLRDETNNRALTNNDPSADKSSPGIPSSPINSITNFKLTCEYRTPAPGSQTYTSSDNVTVNIKTRTFIEF